LLQVLEKRGWTQITDDSEIDRLCTAVIEQNPNLVAQFHAGKTKVLNSLVGKVAKITENRANMAAVVQVLREKLSKLQNT
jgi:aspartyl-tRNA(Asn)/glutamyl-tRNA(Gln) amidotransferase subunit B